ncbi:fused FliR family export protein/FlhB family type III secretion system protein [Clostridium paraputrificum]|uniref:fused FliR family export protein/FlhB family type III secretion system protein n=1 Tax=Clostridium paraputrificum TaxID=29363 RepID=UPI001897FB43|nr:fused FliR family export protein/FlhB family type III secretion system protein [Clostridium paraputrificum]MDB2125066.1 fused FliR family export protein/FlhB family type III secretion system protein [Clostridium paraputrificum]
MVNTAYFLALILVFIRLTSFFLVAKSLFPKGTPAILKGAIGMILSFSIISGINYQVVLEINNNYMLVYSVISEIMSGVILGFIANMIFDFIRMAGGYMDIQIGLSMMNMLDPSSETTSTPFSNLSYFISMVIFFIIDGHHLLIKCLIQSFKVVNIGQNIVFQDTFSVVLDAFREYFVIGVKIAIPLVLIIIITDLCMALVSRTVPAINVMILGMPVKMVVGLLTFIALLPIMIKIVSYAFNLIPDIIEEMLKVLPAAPMVLIFAKEEKTEEATPKKKSEARKKGQVARSKDVGLAITMVTCTLVILLLSSMIVGNLKDTMIYFLQSGMLQDINEMSIKSIVITILLKAALCILPVVIPIMIAGIVASLMQTGFLLTGEPLKPKFSKLNPISGFKNMFSKKSFVDLLKNLAVVTVIGFIGFLYVRDNYDKILQISNTYLPSLGGQVQDLVVGIFFQVSLVLVIIAAADYFVQFRFHQKDLRMTKQEIKEEYKQMEGDPQIKSKIKQKQREMATRRMMASVADATVVITNPTHLSIALKYEEGNNEAPKVVAKGADLVALKIKEVAKENDVPIMENKPLARMIYEQVDIDREVPQEMYQAVAEILAMVYKLKNKK